MKKVNKSLVITSLLCILPIVIGLLIWDKLPSEIPTHFDITGNPDSYSSKLFGVVGIPLFVLVINVVCHFALDNDPKNNGQNNMMMNLGKWISPVISIFVMMTIYAYALGTRVDITNYLMTLLGLMFIVLGNYMPKVKQNYTIGYRNAWTLDNEVIWNKTHRLSGYLMMVLGIMIIVIRFILSNEIYVYSLIVMILIIAVIPMIYSYMLYKKAGK